MGQEKPAEQPLPAPLVVSCEQVVRWTTTGGAWHAERPPDGYVQLFEGYWMPVWYKVKP